MPLWLGVVLMAAVLVIIAVANFGLGRLGDKWAALRRHRDNRPVYPWSDRTGQ
jgi:hypothetical protein